MIEQLFTLQGKTALITGGGKGIGAMMTQGLIESGADVIIASRSLETCEAFAAEMNKLGKGKCTGMTVDLSSVENITTFAEKLSDQVGHLDILINNSGASWGAPLEDYPEKGWDKVMDLNVKAVFFLTKSLLPLLKKQASQENPSRIVMISSVAAVSPDSMMAYSYGPSKAAVKQLGKELAKDLVTDHILVNTIGPAVFESNMTKAFDMTQMAALHPVGRIGKATDIAGLAIFLCSKASSFITGTYIPLDGGFLLRS